MYVAKKKRGVFEYPILPVLWAHTRFAALSLTVGGVGFCYPHTFINVTAL